MATVRMPIRMEIGNHGPIEVGEIEFPARRGELGFVLDWPSVAAALRSAADKLAPTAEITEAQKYAESIIRSARQFDHGAYLERLPGMADLTDAAFDALCEEVYQALKSATVTVTWPQDAELTDAHRCWSCDHLATDHQGDGCHHPITCALVSVETADFDALCSCAVSAESAASPPERDATQAGDNQ